MLLNITDCTCYCQVLVLYIQSSICILHMFCHTVNVGFIIYHIFNEHSFF